MSDESWGRACRSGGVGEEEERREWNVGGGVKVVPRKGVEISMFSFISFFVSFSMFLESRPRQIYLKTRTVEIMKVGKRCRILDVFPSYLSSCLSANKNPNI